MPNAVTRGSEGGASSHLYFTNGTAQYEPGRPNQPLFHWQRLEGTIWTSTVDFATNTTTRYILCKPGATGTTTPNQTASPVGIAAQNFGWNVSSLFLDAYAVLEKVTGSWMGRIHQVPPAVIASPFGAAFGNAFDFPANDSAAWGGLSDGDQSGVNFGTEAWRPSGITSPWTIDVRVRRDRTGFDEALAGFRRNVADGQVYVLFNQNNRVEVIWTDNAGAQQSLSTTATYGTGNFAIRATFDGSNVRIYVDGSLQVTSTPTTVRVIDPAVEFWVGRTHLAVANSPTNTGSNALDGVIDEVRLSNIARTTGASYTVDTAPFTVDANTKLLCSFESRKPVRRVLKAGTVWLIGMYLTAATADTTQVYGFAFNLYKRSAAGAFTYLCGGTSALNNAAPTTITKLYTTTSAVASDVVFEPGDTLQVELWVRGRGGGATGLLNQTMTITYGDPVTVSGGGEDAEMFIEVTATPANGGFRYLWDEAPTGSASSGGTMQKAYVKAFTGAMSGANRPAAIIRSLVPSKGFAGAMSGANRPAATVTHRASKTLVGSITPSGQVIRRANKLLTGAMTSSGAFARREARKVLTGTVTSAGSLTRAISKYFTGNISSIVGTLRRVPNKPLTGSAGTPAGTVRRVVAKALTGTVGSSGALVRLAYRYLAGALTPAGAVTKRVSKAPFTGAVSLIVGTLRRVPNKPLTGSAGAVGPGVLTRAVVKRFAGALTPAGSLLTRASKNLTGVISSAAPAVLMTLSKNFRGYLYGSGRTPDWPLTEPLKAIVGTVIDHENGSAWTGGASIVLHRDVDDEPVAYATSNGTGEFSFSRGADDPYTYHYKTHYDKNGVPYQGVSERGQVPA